MEFGVCRHLIGKHFRRLPMHGSFENLDCWKACRDVRLLIMDMANKFPKREKYDLTDNITRAARSTTRNIAEGFGRYNYQENIQFLRISRGSLYEVLDDLGTAEECGYIKTDDRQNAKKLIEKAIRLVNGYIRYLKKEKNN
jgi:four helix bundle protein